MAGAWIFKVPSSSGSVTLFAFPSRGVWRIPCCGAEVNTSLPVIWLLTWRAFSPAWPPCCTAPKSLMLVSFVFFSFHISCHSSNYHYQNYEGVCSIPSIFFCWPFPSLQFWIEEAWFSLCLLWDICLFSNSLRDIISMIWMLSAWAQGLSSVSILSWHVCLLKSTFLCQKMPWNLIFSSFLILIWHCSGNRWK